MISIIFYEPALNLIIMCMLLPFRKRLQDETMDTQEENDYSYVRELPNEKDKNHVAQYQGLQKEADQQHNHKSHSVKEQASGLDKNKYAYSNPGYSSETPGQNSIATSGVSSAPGSYPLHDLYAQPNKSKPKENPQRSQSSHAKHISTNIDDGEAYDYFNKVVDDEFGFINSDLYSGGLST